MTVFVPDATLEAAGERAARLPLSAVEKERWSRVAAYGSARRPDQYASRAAALRDLIGLPGATDDGVVEAAGRLLAGAVATPDPITDRVLDAALGWLDDDIADAAPLLDLFTGHHRDPEGGPPQADPDHVRRLAGWLGERGVVLEDVAVISGGFSRLMLDVRWTGGRGVVRVEQDGLFATEGRREAAVMRAVGARGYPVPEILWEEPDPAVLGHPFFVMRHVPGGARTDDQGLDDMLRVVAALHALGPSAVCEIAAVDGITAAEAVPAQVRHWHGVYRAAVPHALPLLERCFGWLEANLSTTGPPVVVHGDPGPGNALQDGSGVTAVIDWELAHAGDAAEDWAYLALIRGRRLGSPEEWKQRLARTVGVEYDRTSWDAWEAFNSVKGACVNLTALDVFARTARPTPDQLAIGVAVHLRFLKRAIELTTAGTGCSHSA